MIWWLWFDAYGSKLQIINAIIAKIWVNEEEEKLHHRRLDWPTSIEH